MGSVHADGDRGGGGDNQDGNGGENQGGNGGDNQGQGDDQGEDAQNCTSANLAPGAMVGGAELRVTSAGSTWEKVDLIG